MKRSKWYLWDSGPFGFLQGVWLKSRWYISGHPHEFYGVDYEDASDASVFAECFPQKE